MAKCPRCGRKGLFLKLTSYNLCDSCTAETLRQEVPPMPARSLSAASAPVPTHKGTSAPSPDWRVRLQNITCHMNESRLVLSESQLNASIKIYLEGRLKIVQDCVSIINSTANPDTFYSRIDLLLQKFDELCEVERIRPQLFAKSAIQNANDIRAKQAAAEADMIRRAYAKAKEETSKVKSLQSKQGKYTSFFETMHDYRDRIAPENKELLQRLVAEAGLTSFYSSDAEADDESYDYDAISSLQAEYTATFQQHDKLTEQIGTMYAIANQLKTPDSPEMDRVIALCKEDIALAPKYLEFWQRYDQLTEKDGSQIPKYYPTFSRLAIIYEKRKDYQAALDVCAQAVSLGFTSDRTDGGMIGRAARLTRKLNQERTQNNRISESDTIIIEDSEPSAESDYFTVVKTLLHEVIDISRVSCKNTQSYMSVIIDGKTTKWICRLRIDGKNKSIGIPDDNGKEIRYLISSCDDLSRYEDALKSRVKQIV